MNGDLEVCMHEMEAGYVKMPKVANKLHEGKNLTKKVWRFNTDSIINTHEMTLIKAKFFAKQEQYSLDSTPAILKA